MKLNIYENKQVIKTYEAETYDLMYGTVVDIMNLIDLDKLDKTKNFDDEILDLIFEFLKTGLDKINWLLKDIFDGLTDEEIKKTKVKEIAIVLVNVVTFAFKQMSEIDSKN